MAYETRVRKISESNNVSSNQSTVTIVLEFRRTDYSYYGYNQSGSAYWWIKCDGQNSGNQYFTFNWSIGQNVWKEVGRKTFAVSHNSDGSKSISFSGYIYFGSGVSPGSLSASGSASLTTIPRATTPSLNPTTVTLGGSISISLPRASSSFTHTLYHDFAMATWTQFATNATTSATLSIPLDWANRIPNQTSSYGRILCRTFNNGIAIGDKIVNFNVNVPSSMVPSISSVTVSDTASGINAQFGAYIQGKSSPRIQINASGSYSSTIRSYSTTINGRIYSGSTINLGTIYDVGTINYTTTVTDSRGRTANYSSSFSVLSYSPPSISSFSVVRCDSSGTETSDGTYVKVSINGSISSCNNKNSNSYRVDYKLSSSSSWSSLFTGSGYTINTSQVKTITNGFQQTSSYDFRIVLSDYFTSSTVIRSISTSFTLLNFRSTGKGFAIGKASEKDAFEINMDIYDKFGAFVGNGLTTSGSNLDPNTTIEELILTNTNTPNGGYMYIETKFYQSKSQTANRAQTALPYNSVGSEYHRYYYNGQWSSWRRHTNADEAKVKTATTDVAVSRSFAPFEVTNEFSGSAPTYEGYSVQRLSGHANGNVLVCTDNGWVCNVRNATVQDVTSITWTWLLIPTS